MGTFGIIPSCVSTTLVPICPHRESEVRGGPSSTLSGVSSPQGHLRRNILETPESKGCSG